MYFSLILSHLIFKSCRQPRKSSLMVFLGLKGCLLSCPVGETVNTQDLKSCSPKGLYEFDSRMGHRVYLFFFLFFPAFSGRGNSPQKEDKLLLAHRQEVKAQTVNPLRV